MISDSQLGSSSFLGKRADKLSMIIEQQILEIFNDLGIIIPVRSCSLMTVFDQNGPVSVADIAKQLQQSHQLVSQKIPVLNRLNLVMSCSDPHDSRRKIFQLTDEGLHQCRLLKKHTGLIEKAYNNLNKEVGADIYSILGQAIEALESTSLRQRITPDIKNCNE